MTSDPDAALHLPSFLYGSLRSVQQKAEREGKRCGERYRQDGTFPEPGKMEEVPPGEVVVAHEVVDFQRERPAWRLYMVSHVMGVLSEGTPSQSPMPARHAYEAHFRETAWGALFFATAHMSPVSAERTARRIQAVLRFWEPLQVARYLFKHPMEAHALEDLLAVACDWVLRVWCPGDAPVRARLESAARRMATATRDECIEVIIQELSRALDHAGQLNYPDMVADPSFQRERLRMLDSRSFERLSGAYTGELIRRLRQWDWELGMQ